MHGITNLILFVVLVCGCYGTPASFNSQASLADDFIESIGVATHWSYFDTPYGQFDAVSQLLVESGIRHFRDGVAPSVLTQLTSLGSRGLKMCAVLEPIQPLQTSLDQLKSIITKSGKQAAVSTVEGPNEPDLFWVRSNRTYKDLTFEKGGAILFLKDVYSAVKADPQLSHITVIGIALGTTLTYDHKNPWWTAGQLSSGYCDWGNFHPYAGGGNPFSYNGFKYGGINAYWWVAGHPLVKMGGTSAPNSWMFDAYHPPYAPLPMASTECGYSSNYAGGGQAEHVLGKYMPRLYAGHYMLGVKRSYVYEFLNEWDNPSDRESNFGFLRHDLSKKPHYLAVQSLITLLSEGEVDRNFVPQDMNYTIDVKDANADWTADHHFVQNFLLQKSDETFYLIIWNEVTNDIANVNPHPEVFPPPMPTTVTITGTTKFTPTLYSYNDNWELVETKITVNGNQISFGTVDTVMVLKLVQGSSNCHYKETLGVCSVDPKSGVASQQITRTIVSQPTGNGGRPCPSTNDVRIC